MLASVRAWYGRASLRTKLSIHLVLSTAVFIGLLLPLVLYIEKQAMLAGAEQAGFRVAEMFARSSVQAVIADDYLLMQHVVNGIASDPDVRHAMILAPNGEVLAHSRPGERGRRHTDPAALRAAQARGRLMQELTAADGTPVYDFAVPLRVLTDHRATARVAISIARELNALQRTRNSILLFACGILALGLAWATYQARRLTRPIRALVEGAREVQQGHLGHRLAVETRDELGEIAAAFNAMTASLERMIEDLRRSHDALTVAQEDAVRRARMVAIGELAAAVAHEIRNPLGALSNCVEMLRESPRRQPDDAELLEIVHEETVRLGAIVSDFLALGRPRPPHLAAVDVHELLQDTANLLRRDEARSARVTVVLHGPPTPLFVRGDRDQLCQVVFNLFMNACHAMGTEGGTIEASAEPRASAIAIIVSDSGPGIPADALARIFEPFFTTRSDGTGLGLAIVRGIVDAHGGTIEVTSPAEHGAIFTCMLPSALPDDDVNARSTTPAVIAHG